MSQGAPRLYGTGSGRHRHYNACFRDLEARYGPFDAVARQQAAACASFWVEFRTDTEALSAAEHVRRGGKGRRPSVAAIARLKKRRGLSWQTYDSAMKRLEELSAAQRPHDLARRLTAVNS